MLIMLAQVTSMTEQAWRMEQNRIDNFAKARGMVDMITDDLQRAVFRGDLPAFGTGGPAATPATTASGLYYFTGTSFTNAFYTELPGRADRGVHLRCGTFPGELHAPRHHRERPDKIVLQRSDLAVPWTSSQNILFQGDIQHVAAKRPPHSARGGARRGRFPSRIPARRRHDDRSRVSTPVTIHPIPWWRSISAWR